MVEHVRFTLTYQGPLRGSTAKVAQHKHEVRRALHPQLRALWGYEPLRGISDRWLRPVPYEFEGDDEVSAVREVAGQTFVVLVRSELKLVAELDILLLRPEPPGNILQRADIDNRLKVLFDALRRPENAQEIPGGWVPSSDEQPLFCLLDDDRLITRVNVDTDRLLAAESDDNVALTIRVSLRASSPTWASVGLLY